MVNNDHAADAAAYFIRGPLRWTIIGDPPPRLLTTRCIGETFPELSLIRDDRDMGIRAINDSGRFENFLNGCYINLRPNTEWLRIIHFAGRTWRVTWNKMEEIGSFRGPLEARIVGGVWVP